MDIIFDILPLIGALLCFGAVAGFMAGLLGIGGGLILVPALYFSFSFFQNDLGIDSVNLMHIAVGTSLASIVFTGMSSSFAHYKKGSVDFSLVKNIGFGIILGVIFATWIADRLDSQSMKLIFASIIVILAVIMIANPARFRISDERPHQPFASLAGVIIGWVSALAGIGGAALSVPYMTLHGVSIYRAVGTACALGVVVALPAALGFMIIGAGVAGLPPFSVGYVNFMALLFIIITSVIFAPIGARVAHNISVRKLKVIFAGFMILVAINMWHSVING